MTDSPSLVRLAVVGQGGVGKSCLILQYTSKCFITKYDPTLEDCYRKQVTVDEHEVILDIYDTAGQDEFAPMRDGYYRKCDAFMLVYRIDKASTLEELRDIHDAILGVKGGDGDAIPFILVGNKCDLPDEVREVSQEQGGEMAKQFNNNCKFFETSAKLRINVDDIFLELVRGIVWRRNEHRQTANNNNDHKDRKNGLNKSKLKRKKICLLF